MKNLILILLTFLSQTLTLRAQKLPSLQTASVTLPANFKIDGSAAEWNNKFQAKNNSTDVFYTIANNEELLYLVVQATDPIITKKILGGGISFIIHTGPEKEGAAFSVTFPLIEKSYQLSVFQTVSQISGSLSRQQKDSLMMASNKKIGSLATEIKLSGFKTLGDTLSVYNDTGIKCAALVNRDGALTCEFLVPLKLLGVTSKDGKQIAYNLILNGITSIIKVTHSDGVVVTGIPHGLSTEPADLNIVGYPTDFWGTYLIK